MIKSFSPFLLELDDSCVCLIGQLCEQQRVVAAEALPGFAFVVIFVQLPKGDIMVRSMLGIVSPDYGCYAADSDFPPQISRWPSAAGFFSC